MNLQPRSLTQPRTGHQLLKEWTRISDVDSHSAPERHRIIEDALKCISEVDEWALRHSAYRLDAEVRYFTDLLTWLDDPARGGA
jgi:hypothetical protein